MSAETGRMMRRAVQAAGTVSGDGAEQPLSAPPARPRRKHRDQKIRADGLPDAVRPATVGLDAEADGASGLAYSAVRRLRVIVERLLEQTPGDALCDACLAFAAEAALIDMRRATEELPRGRPAVERGAGHCQSCGRETVVTVFRAAAGVMDGGQ